MFIITGYARPLLEESHPRRGMDNSCTRIRPPLKYKTQNYGCSRLLNREIRREWFDLWFLIHKDHIMTHSKFNVVSLKQWFNSSKKTLKSEISPLNYVDFFKNSCVKRIFFLRCLSFYLRELVEWKNSDGFSSCRFRDTRYSDKTSLMSKISAYQIYNIFGKRINIFIFTVWNRLKRYVDLVTLFIFTGSE